MTNEKLIAELDSVRNNLKSMSLFVADLKAMVKLVQQHLEHDYEEELESCIGTLSMAEEEFENLTTKLMFTNKFTNSLIAKLSEEIVKEQLNDR